MTLTESVEIELAKRTLLTLSPGTDAVVCRSGTLWITQDNDPSDIIISAGERFWRKPGVRTIVYALDPATLSVQQRQTVVPVQRTFGARPAAVAS